MLLSLCSDDSYCPSLPVSMTTEDAHRCGPEDAKQIVVNSISI